MFQHRSVIEYGIIGLGRFGFALTKSLFASGKDMIAIDMIDSRVKQARNITDNAFVVGSFDKDMLEDSGIQNCGTVIVCIGDSIDLNVLTALNVISMGVERVIARAMSYEHGLVLEKIGAEVIFPENDMAIRLSHKLVNSNIMESIELRGDIAISELKLNAKFAGQSIQQINLRQKYNLNIIALEHYGVTTTEIDPSFILEAEDIIVVIGQRSNIGKLQAFLSK